MDFSQSFIQHAYIELHMPPKSGGGFAIDEHHLHIWPRHAFMLIGLPNKVSLIAPSLTHAADSLSMAGRIVHLNAVCTFQ